MGGGPYSTREGPPRAVWSAAGPGTDVDVVDLPGAGARLPRRRAGPRVGGADARRRRGGRGAEREAQRGVAGAPRRVVGDDGGPGGERPAGFLLVQWRRTIGRPPVPL